MQWSFEKFLVDSEGEVVDRYRFRPVVVPDDPRIVSAIESVLGPSTD